MKKWIFLLCIAFISSTLCIAQNTITREDFEQMVDYANCNYVKSFIEKNDVGKPYFKEYYEKKVKPELEKVTLDSFKTILTYGELMELLNNNQPAQQLAKKINERKLKFNEFQDKEALIKSLVTSGWSGIDLSRTAANIQNEILTKFNPTKSSKTIKFSESEVIKTQTIQTTAQVEELQSKLDQLEEEYNNLKNDTRIIEYQKASNNFRLIVFSIFGLILTVIIAICLILNKRTSSESIIKQVLASQEIAEKFTSKDTLNNLTQSYKLNEKDFSAIVDRVYKLLNAKENHQQFTTPLKENLNSSQTTTKYLKGKSGKTFSRVDNTPDNSFFKLFNESDDNALFEFSGDEAEAIAKRIFSEDICIIVSGSYQNANFVKTNKPGKIKHVGDKWEVTEPIKIELV